MSKNKDITKVEEVENVKLDAVDSENNDLDKKEKDEKVQLRNIYSGNVFFRAENRHIKPGDYFKAYTKDLKWAMDKGYVVKIDFK